MRFCSMLFLWGAGLALAACNPDPNPGPQIDLVGSSRFLSTDRRTTTLGDTFTTRIYAQSRDTSNGPELRHLRIRVEYAPTFNPIVYPAPPFDPTNFPKDNLIYLDSTLKAGQRQIAFQFTAGNRTTSGRENWTFEVEDADGRVSSRGFRVAVRNNDSALVYHRYTLRLPAPNLPAARRFLALRPGLALPAFTLRTSAANQALIDLVYLPGAGSSLAAPNDPLLNSALASWTTRRATQLRSTSLTQANFESLDTETELTNAFTTGSAFTPATRTGALTKGQVVAFRTADNSTGVIFVQDLLKAPTPAALLQVRVTK